MSPVNHRNEERPQEPLRSSLHTERHSGGAYRKARGETSEQASLRRGTGLRLLAGDLRRLCPAAAALLIYGIVTHLVFDRFCPMLILTDFPCPGCGMTRALFLVLTGHFSAAWKFHPPVYGWIFLGLAFGVRRYVIKREASVRETYIWMLLLGVLLVSSLVLYGYRILQGFPPGIVEPGRTLFELIVSG